MKVAHMNSRWLAIIPDAPVTATLMVFFQVFIISLSSCDQRTSRDSWAGLQKAST